MNVIGRKAETKLMQSQSLLKDDNAHMLALIGRRRVLFFDELPWIAQEEKDLKH